jgi:hypothetical protein
MVEPLPPGRLLVLRPRRPDPTPPARTSPPSRARRSRVRFTSQPIAAGLVVLGAALVLVAQSAAATQQSYQISALKQEQVRLLAERDDLQARLAQARAANRVNAAALALGLNRPSRWQYVHGTQSPIALLPRPTLARGGVWTGVLAILSGVLGRPLDVATPSP